MSEVSGRSQEPIARSTALITGVALFVSSHLSISVNSIHSVLDSQYSKCKVHPVQIGRPEACGKVIQQQVLSLGGTGDRSSS